MAAPERIRPGGGPAPVHAAARARVGLVLALFGVAGIGWAWTVRATRGMDAGPWTSLGSLGWFLGTWVVAMAAMMLPSVAPTVALFARISRQRTPLRPWLFVSGYLLTWAVAGLVAYAVGVTATTMLGEALAWRHAGRALTGATLIAAAGYEVTPLKDVCLGKCRSPLGVLLGSWRDGDLGAVAMGAENGAWCLGCCWALMASLFALGVMSISWMAFIAGVIALEKTVPWRPRMVTWGMFALLLVIGILVLAVPNAVPAPGTTR